MSYDRLDRPRYKFLYWRLAIQGFIFGILDLLNSISVLIPERCSELTVVMAMFASRLMDF